jgi:hypothetical protein
VEIITACSTSKESQLLHASLSDFSRNGPRAAYAEWLAASGDKARSLAVRATIEAFHNLEQKPLDDLDLDPCWARMLGIPLLSALIGGRLGHDTDGLKDLRDRVFRLIRPALSLSCDPYLGEPGIGDSYLWGLPDIPDGEAWPQISALSNWSDAKPKLPQDNHAAFVGQFAFRDMRETVLGQELPLDGGFMVFAITEVFKLGIVETLVRPWNNKASLARHAAPPDVVEDRLGDKTNAPHPFHFITLEEGLSIPDASDGPFAREIPGCHYDEEYCELYRDLKDACGAGELGFGGYLCGTSGGDPSPDTGSLRLAVLRTNPDVGIVHFAIPAVDLKNGRLDRVEYVWNDWDS